MIGVGTVFDDGNVRLEIARLEPDRRNAELELRAVYVPGSKPPPLHYHPNQEERFLVHEGALRFRVGKEERIVAAGQELLVPPGAHHLACNASASEPAVVRWITRPALRTAEFFDAIYRWQKAGKSPLELALIVRAFREEWILARPGRVVQSCAFGLLAAIARLTGRKL
jgi:quercetin dioxygenase-like cupin family protein